VTVITNQEGALSILKIPAPKGSVKVKENFPPLNNHSDDRSPEHLSLIHTLQGVDYGLYHIHFYWGGKNSYPGVHDVEALIASIKAMK